MTRVQAYICGLTLGAGLAFSIMYTVETMAKFHTRITLIPFGVKIDAVIVP